uniref:Transmembrane protein n=1 Tax=Heterorhabditis bacteriophora TaxID=37862 RepID=A0A1I7XD16_HETBA
MYAKNFTLMYEVISLVEEVYCIILMGVASIPFKYAAGFYNSLVVPEGIRQYNLEYIKVNMKSDSVGVERHVVKTSEYSYRILSIVQVLRSTVELKSRKNKREKQSKSRCCSTAQREWYTMPNGRTGLVVRFNKTNRETLEHVCPNH